MMSASHVAESLRDSEEPQPRCGVSLGEADLRGGVQREVPKFAAIYVYLWFLAVSAPRIDRQGLRSFHQNDRCK